MTRYAGAGRNTTKGADATARCRLPEGMGFEDANRRFTAAVKRSLALSRGDIIIVSHSSVIQTLLCTIEGRPFDCARDFVLPYGSVTRLEYDGDFRLCEYGVLPVPELTPELAARLLEAAELPEELHAHSRLTAETAMEIVCALAAAGACLDENLVYAAALLHDVSKGTPDHALAGAGLMSQLGYPALAPLMAQHHDLEDGSKLDEAMVVNVADKLCGAAGRVRVSERFRASLDKCRDEEARRAHERRYQSALAAAKMINDFCGKDVVPI